MAARDGIDVEETTIPDGFYLVGRENYPTPALYYAHLYICHVFLISFMVLIANADRPEAAFNAAIIEGVSRVTHLVPESSTLLGE